MILPTTPALDTPIRNAPPVRSAPIDIPNSTPPTYSRASHETWHLRRDLYYLKDVIQQALEKLSTSYHIYSPARPRVTKMYVKLFNDIGLIVSNHASDWIESGLAGGLTYPEFLALDRVAIRELAGQIVDVLRGDSRFSGDHDGDDGLGQGMKIMKKAEMEKDQLERLEGLAVVLESTFGGRDGT
jgi:hypothetical protein